MEDPNKDLKEGEEETPTGDDQPDKKTPTSDESDEEETDDEESDSNKDDDDDSDDSKDDSDEEVKISKSELEQLRKDAKEKESYRKGLIRLNKARGRNLPGSEPVTKKKDDDGDDDFGETPKEDYVTKKELALRDEKRAVNDACKNEEILLNWDEIIVFYQRPKENSYESQSAAIANAHKLWRADNGITDNPDEKKEAKKKADKAKQDLASEKGLSKGKDKKPTPPKKSIIPRKQKMEDWYGK